MSLLDILKLVGFATGAALHFYLAWLLSRRHVVRAGERPLFALGISLGAWHLGNFLATIFTLLAHDRLFPLRKLADTIAYIGLAFLPPLLAHAHFRLWGLLDRNAPRRFFGPLIALGYVPMVVIPWVVVQLWREPYIPPIERLANLLLPFILWFVMIFAECAGIDFWLTRRIEAERERRFFRTFGAALLAIAGVFLVTYVLGGRKWGVAGSYIDTIARLSSLIPTAIIAYYIYRYRYLELIIRQSLVYAVFAVLVMVIYVFVIRRVSLAIEARTALRSDVVEAILILGLMFLAGPLRRFTERQLQQLFVREVGLYRDLVFQVGARAASFNELDAFVTFVDNQISESLELSEVRLVPRSRADLAVAQLCEEAEEQDWRQVEEKAWLDRFTALACYVLWREARVVGLLFVHGERDSLTVEKREVLSVLAGHLAVAIENCHLLEEKVKLERQLAAGERLTALGQMAATIAHEIKNPLSSIKSIVQTMREDEAIGREYARDLDLMTGEIDRLSRSVSQLLTFSRPGAVAAASARLSEVLESVIALSRAEFTERGATSSVELKADPQLTGEMAAALREALANLVVNGVQSTEVNGKVQIESEFAKDGRLHLAVIDDGSGVSSQIESRIFDPFFTTKQRGTGLGLAIVSRRLAELNGSIKVTSPLDGVRGTRFDLLVPLNDVKKT
jgi:signal transduction histidine kinase